MSFQVCVVCLVFTFCGLKSFQFRSSQNRKSNLNNNVDLPLSKAGETIVREAASKVEGTIFKSVNQQLRLQCKNKATKYLMKEFPTSEIRWKHNSENFILEPSRMTYRLDSLYIQNLQTKDTGVFSCQVDLDARRHYVVGIYIIVVDRTSLHVLPGDSVKLNCNSKQLGLLFPNMVGFWEKNGKPVPNSNKSAVNPMYDLYNADERLAGSWTCNVFHKTNNKMWVTAQYRISIAPVPPFMTRTRLYIRNNKVKSGLMLMAFAFLLVVLMNLIMKISESKQRAKQKEIEQLKKMLGIRSQPLDGLLDDTAALIDQNTSST